MKSIFITSLVLALMCGNVKAQSRVVSWSQTIIKTEKEATVSFSAIIKSGWQLYSSDFDPNLGPIVTEFIFEPNPNYALIDSIQPIYPKKKYDDIWGGEYTYFVEVGQFDQKIQLITGAPFKTTATINYQVCNEANGNCIPFSDKIELNF